MSVDIKFKKFHTIWNKHVYEISESLRIKYGWKRKNDLEIWDDITSEAMALCCEKFSSYDNRKGEVFPFLLYWSEIAMMRFLRSYNRDKFGNQRFEEVKYNLHYIRDAVQDEGNPRYLLAFLFKHYLDLSAEEFHKQELHYKSLEDLFNIARKIIIDRFCFIQKPKWHALEIDRILDLLRKKMFKVKDELFYPTKNNFPEVFNSWSYSVKKNFVKTKLASPARHPIAEEDAAISGSRNELSHHTFSTPKDHQNVDISGTSHAHNPLQMVLIEEYIQMQINLLRFIIKHTNNPRHLFAFLFTLCSVTSKSFVSNNYHRKSFGELTIIFKREYLHSSSLSEGVLLPVFSALEEKIEPVKDDIFQKDNQKIQMADWTYRVKKHVEELILRGDGLLGRDIRQYYIDKIQ